MCDCAVGSRRGFPQGGEEENCIGIPLQGALDLDE